MGKKLVEEAVEVMVDAIGGSRQAVVNESGDLLYHLVVLWAACGVLPQDIWSEMTRRERLFGIAEKLAKSPVEARRSVVALERDGRTSADSRATRQTA
jgi:phosphoribosyl-ATP pyrophosphohydrolase